MPAVARTAARMKNGFFMLVAVAAVVTAAEGTILATLRQTPLGGSWPKIRIPCVHVRFARAQGRTADQLPTARTAKSGWPHLSRSRLSGSICIADSTDSTARSAGQVRLDEPAG